MVEMEFKIGIGQVGYPEIKIDIEFEIGQTGYLGREGGARVILGGKGGEFRLEIVIDIGGSRWRPRSRSRSVNLALQALPVQGRWDTNPHGLHRHWQHHCKPTSQAA